MNECMFVCTHTHTHTYTHTHRERERERCIDRRMGDKACLGGRSGCEGRSSIECPSNLPTRSDHLRNGGSSGLLLGWMWIKMIRIAIMVTIGMGLSGLSSYHKNEYHVSNIIMGYHGLSWVIMGSQGYYLTVHQPSFQDYRPRPQDSSPSYHQR